ncbi:MAG: site-specific DNA-methyltransferase [Desulfovibrio sp.]
MTSRIYQGDSLEVLRTLPDESVHCVVTSPPYWRLRDYGCAGQIGLEDWVDCGWYAAPARFKAILAENGVGPCGEYFVCRLVTVFSEVRRVLRKDGTAWVNMGDSYASSSTSNHGRGKNAGSRSENPPRIVPREGLKPKDLVGQPWRLALALQADGWFLRSDIIWHKPTAMPENVDDRPAKAHEYLFLLSRGKTYFFDMPAIKEPVTGGAQPRGSGVNRKVQKVPGGWDTAKGAHGSFHRKGRGAPEYRPKQNASFSAAVHGLVEMRNKRTVWTIPAARFPEAHFATFPPALVEPCIKAGCPHGGVVLDPFFGSGTVGLVARRLGRDFVGIDLNPDYCRMAERRIERETGLFGPVEIIAPQKEAKAS